MVRRIFSIALAGLWVFCFSDSQSLTTHNVTSNSTVHDAAMGVSFANIGTMQQVDSVTYRVVLSTSENSTALSPYAQITVTARPFVDLPGSFGGRLYLDGNITPSLMQSRVFVDSVSVANDVFRREYWTVYAGMGMWEEVINCYRQEGGRCYSVSLIQDRPAGKPGEEAEGKQITTEELRIKILGTLQDPANKVVDQFTTLLQSVRIQR